MGCLFEARVSEMRRIHMKALVRTRIPLTPESLEPVGNKHQPGAELV